MAPTLPLPLREGVGGGGGDPAGPLPPTPSRKGRGSNHGSRPVPASSPSLARELRLSLRHGADTLAALLFFLLAAALFPLAIGPAPETLGRIAPGIVWVCALLAALLPLDRLFGADFEDGSLDQLLLCGLPPAAIALAKAVAHWLVTGLPLLLAAAPLAVMLRMPGRGAAGAAGRTAARHACCCRCSAPPAPRSCWALAAAACCCRCWSCRSPPRC